jgi:hypothetical protein
LPYVIYEASDGLVSYHVDGADYSLDFEISDLRPPNGDVLRTKQESLSGKVETNKFGRRRIWSLTTIPYQRASEQAKLLREFLNSTDDGQAFTLDPYGVVDGDVQPLSVIREDDGYTEDKFQEIDGVNDYVRYSFQVREV